jgi:pilus assembly protein CpaE
MATYFVSTDREADKARSIEGRIRGVIPEVITLKGMDDLVHAISQRSRPRSTVLVFASPKDTAAFAKLVELAARYRDRAFFILISDDIPAADYKRLVRTGSADWVSAGAVPQEVLDLIAKQAGAADARTGGAEPIVVCLVPSAGGVGNATLAVEVASQLKAGKRAKGLGLCVVDLDFQSSHVCDHLDIEPRLQIQEIANSPERLDEQLFEIFVSRHSSGLHVFAAPRSRFDVCEVSVETLDTLFEMISTRYDIVLIDLPLAWFKWTPHVIAASDAVIVTGANTIPGLRRMAETVVTVRDIRRAASQFAVVVNRCERGLLGGFERRHHAEKILGREKVFFIGEDPKLVEAANAGTPLALSDPGCRASKEMAALAAFCEGVKSTRAAAS